MKRWAPWLILLVLVLLVLALPLPGMQGALFSPGTGSHDKVGCIQCHEAFSPENNCTQAACHPITKSSFKTATGFKFHNQVKAKACSSCHSEHAPKSMSLKPFDHARFPVALNPECQVCHDPPNKEFHKSIPNKTPCIDCHDGTQWKGAKFSHSVLPEKQLNQCISCHKPPTKALHKSIPANIPCTGCHEKTSWKGAKFSHTVLPSSQLNKCQSCHTRPKEGHHELLSDQCSTCHKPSSWENVRFTHQGLNSKGQVSCGLCHTAPREEHSKVDINCGRCHSTAYFDD